MTSSHPHPPPPGRRRETAVEAWTRWLFALALGIDHATHFLGKPYTRLELTQKVRDVLDSTL